MLLMGVTEDVPVSMLALKTTILLRLCHFKLNGNITMTYFLVHLRFGGTEWAMV